LKACTITENCLTEHRAASPEETEALGERFVRKLQPGSVVALKGGLGAGKTCFTRGIARGLGITENVTSPTYTIVSEYSARLNGQTIPLYHIDAYRLNGDEDFENTGAGELINDKTVAIIEWSERIPRSIPAGAITVEIEITGPESRLLRISKDIGDSHEPACH
jgi:tRNA threonylcarbamoyladenosine biosynthesis protein TsaE